MAKQFDFEQRAKECAQHAEAAVNEQAREVWRRMQAYWLKRAAETRTPRGLKTTTTSR